MSAVVQEDELDKLLLEAETNEEGLIPLIISFAHSVADRWDIAELYHQKVTAVCDKWIDGKNIAAGIKELASVLFYYYVTQYDKVDEIATKAISIFEENDADDLLGVACMVQGTTLRSLGHFDKAVELLGRANHLIDSKGGFRIYNSFANYQLAEIFVQLKDYDLAEIHYVQSATVAQTSENTIALFRTTNGLGNLYLAVEEMEKAFEYLNRSLEMSDSPSQSSRALCDLGIYHLKLDEPDKAVELLERSFQIRHEGGFVDASSTALIHLGNALLDLNRLDEAEQKALQALAITEEFNSKSKMVLVFDLLGRIKESQKSWEAAVNYLRKHEILRNELSTQQMRNIYKTKNKLISAQKDLLEEVHKEITDSIAYAKRIQTAILPPQSLLDKHLKDHFVLYMPKDVVAGDFFWLEEAKGTVYFAAADCTGHGVPGAMVSVICNNALNRSVREYGLTTPGEILSKTREIVIQEFEKSEEEVKDGMDIGLCALKGNAIQFSGANNPLWLIRDHELIEVKGDKQPVGKFIYSTDFNTHSLDLKKGDTIYLLTDGFVDQFGGEKGKKFKAKQLKELLLSVQEKSLAEQKDVLRSEFEKWRGTLEQVDDVCLIAFRL